jgi:hypothetical protein
MLSESILSFLFFFAFIFEYGLVMAPPSIVSASDGRCKLVVYISECCDAARSLFLEIAT